MPKSHNSNQALSTYSSSSSSSSTSFTERNGVSSVREESYESGFRNDDVAIRAMEKRELQELNARFENYLEILNTGSIEKKVLFEKLEEARRDAANQLRHLEEVYRDKIIQFKAEVHRENETKDFLIQENNPLRSAYSELCRTLQFESERSDKLRLRLEELLQTKNKLSSEYEELSSRVESLKGSFTTMETNKEELSRLTTVLSQTTEQITRRDLEIEDLRAQISGLNEEIQNIRRKEEIDYKILEERYKSLYTTKKAELIQRFQEQMQADLESAEKDLLYEYKVEEERFTRTRVDDIGPKKDQIKVVEQNLIQEQAATAALLKEINERSTKIEELTPKINNYYEYQQRLEAETKEFRSKLKEYQNLKKILQDQSTKEKHELVIELDHERKQLERAKLTEMKNIEDETEKLRARIKDIRRTLETNDLKVKSFESEYSRKEIQYKRLEESNITLNGEIKRFEELLTRAEANVPTTTESSRKRKNVDLSFF